MIKYVKERAWHDPRLSEEHGLSSKINKKEVLDLTLIVKISTEETGLSETPPAWSYELGYLLGDQPIRNLLRCVRFFFFFFLHSAWNALFPVGLALVARLIGVTGSILTTAYK